MPAVKKYAARSSAIVVGCLLVGVAWGTPDIAATQARFDAKKAGILDMFFRKLNDFEEQAAVEAQLDGAYGKPVLMGMLVPLISGISRPFFLGSRELHSVIRNLPLDPILPACTCDQHYHHRTSCSGSIASSICLWALMSIIGTYAAVRMALPDLFVYQQKVFIAAWFTSLRACVTDGALLEQGDTYYAKMISKELKTSDQKLFLNFIRKLIKHGRDQLIDLLKNQQTEAPCQQ